MLKSITVVMPNLLLIMMLLFVPGNATAETVLNLLLPTDNEIAGWIRAEEPRLYRGEELFQMIDGGADIYHEYGFSQVLAGDYENNDGKFIRVEIYEMAAPEDAYGIYSFKIGRNGVTRDLGQAAFLEDYFLNFWKGNLLVTIVGSDSESQTVDAGLSFGKYVDRHYAGHADQPELVKLFLDEPVALSYLKYVRGSIGAMNSYVFDTEDVFKVHEGIVGVIAENKVFVFRYADAAESRDIFNSVADRFSSSQRFSNAFIEKDLCTLRDRDLEHIIIKRAGQNLAIVIGPDRDEIYFLVEQIVKKLTPPDQANSPS